VPDRDQIRVAEVERSHLSEPDVWTVVYDCWDMEDRTDPAANQWRRVAVFYATEPSTDLQSLVKAERGSYRLYWDGLAGATVDEVLEQTKERDRDAERHAKESERLMERATNWRGDPIEGTGTRYEEFLAAVDRVAEDETDEEAWRVIDGWRARQLRPEERQYS
jgi:hypothetical protein